MERVVDWVRSVERCGLSEGRVQRGSGSGK